MNVRVHRLLCRLGRHTWGPYASDDGPELMRTCLHCGKVHFSTRPGSGPGGMEQRPHGSVWQ